MSTNNNELRESISGIIMKNTFSTKQMSGKFEPNIHEIDFEATVTDLVHEIASEKERLVEEIRRLGTGLSINPEDNTEYEKGYYGAKEDILGIIHELIQK